MNTTLTGAFKIGRLGLQSITDLYEKAGFFTMRALIDDSFFNINDDGITSPRLRKAASLLNSTTDLLQDKAFKRLSETYASSNLTPKPDIKKPLLNLGNVVLNGLTKMSVGQVAVLALGIGVTVIATHLHGGGAASMASDTLATYLGVKPNSNPEPTLENG